MPRVEIIMPAWIRSLNGSARCLGQRVWAAAVGVNGGAQCDDRFETHSPVVVAALQQSLTRT